jgi:two-component system cell cycle response regulator CpdR
MAPVSRILLAEDDTTLRTFLAKALERAGHEVFAVGDGLEALAAAKTV